MMDSEEIKCSKKFGHFASHYLTLFSYQKWLIEHYHNNRFSIVKKFDQGGFTKTTILYLTWKCLFKFDQDVLYFCKSDKEAAKCCDIVDSIIESLPFDVDMFASPRHRRFPNANSSILFIQPENIKARPVTDMVFDDAAFIDDMKYHWSCFYPLISTGGKCTVLSTPNGTKNWFYDVYCQASQLKNNFAIFNSNIYDHPSYGKPDWIINKRKEIGNQFCAQKYEGVFLDIEEIEEIHKIESIKKLHELINT